MSEIRLGLNKPERSFKKSENELKEELQKLIIDKETKVFYDAEELTCKNSDKLCVKDKLKIYHDSDHKPYKFKITKLFGLKEISLENFFRTLIIVIGNFWKGEVFRIKIGFGWFITDQNRQTEYIAFNKSRLMDDYAIKIQGTKFQLLNNILDLELHNFHKTTTHAYNSHVATTHCIHSLNEKIPLEDVQETRDLIFRDPGKYLRCSGICYFKTLKRVCSMFIQIEKP